MAPLTSNGVVYVPGRTARRTVNTGYKLLACLGVYSAHAGHDNSGIAERNFRSAVVKRDGCR
jgi:glucose-6-phosphate isomerase